MLATHHATREMVTVLVYPRIYARRVAKPQKLIEKGIYAALKEGSDLGLTAGSPELKVCRLGLIRNPVDSQGETLLSV
jgi:hypothetical protein